MEQNEKACPAHRCHTIREQYAKDIRWKDKEIPRIRGTNKENVARSEN